MCNFNSCLPGKISGIQALKTQDQHSYNLLDFSLSKVWKFWVLTQRTYAKWYRLLRRPSLTPAVSHTGCLSHRLFLMPADSHTDQNFGQNSHTGHFDRYESHPYQRLSYRAKWSASTIPARQMRLAVFAIRKFSFDSI